MSRASRLRAVLFTDGASYAERLDAARRAVARASADDADADESAIVLAWTRAALRDAARDRGATRETGRDAPTSDERRGDDARKRRGAGRAVGAARRAASAALGGGGEKEDGERGDAATGVRGADEGRRRRTDDAGVVRGVRRGGEERDVGRGESGADERGARGGGGGGERAAERAGAGVRGF